MTDEKLVHVRIEDPEQDELADLRDIITDALDDYTGSGKVVVSDNRMSIGEVPALDAYADELAARVAEEIETTNK